MNNQICILIFLLTCRICNAQNLVPNPSFEDTIACPFTTAQVNFAIGWSDFGKTPDYYNACSSAYMSVPTNFVSYQQAATGNAYCGLGTFNINDTTTREFIGATLICPLQIGTKYYVSAKFNLADNSSYDIATNKQCIRFSTTIYSATNSAPQDNYAQIINDSIIVDTAGWFLVRGSFIADSSYSYIIIGNFFQDYLTDTMKLSPTPYASYYLVDDVCVSTDSLTCNSPVGVSEIKNDSEIYLFPNPFSNKINITIKRRNETVEVSLYDVTSRKIINQSFTNSTSINTEQLAKGIYLYEVRNKSGVIKKGKVVKD